jgi:hypothetical protein
MEICRLYCYKVFHGRKKTAVNVNHDKHIVCKMRALFILLSFADGACFIYIYIYTAKSIHSQFLLGFVVIVVLWVVEG